MKIAVFTDTHGIMTKLLELYPNIEADLVFVLGDLYNTEAKMIDNLFKVPILGIHGNHDDERTFNETSILDIHNCLVEADDMTILGIQGSHRYKPTQIYGYTQQEAINIFKQLPKTNILLCHDGPYNENQDDAHCGLKGITEYINKNQPDIFIYGHYHKNQHYKINNTDCYCVYELVVFEIENNKVISYQNYNT